ncbi:hypothetical protein PMAYCL1PPCAC_20161, partial [Pristionchus mayeri]
CLIVECKRIHVAKAVLATISPVLKTMLYGKFEEGGKREIEIHDVSHTDFVNFLNLVYSSLHAMDDDSVEGILSIADRFNTKIVLEAVEAFILGNSQMHIAKKLLLTDTYELEVTQAALLLSCKNLRYTKSMELTEWYTSFSDKLKGQICDRMMEIMGDS